MYVEERQIIRLRKSTFNGNSERKDFVLIHVVNSALLDLIQKKVQEENYRRNGMTKRSLTRERGSYI